MTKKKLFLLFTPVLIIIFIVTGCKQSTEISNSKLIDYYAQSIDGLADVINGYSKSLETGSNYVAAPAKKQLKWINSTRDKLKEDTSGSKKTKHLSDFLDSLDDEIREYKDNNFDDQYSVSDSVTKNRKSFEKSVNIDDSTKVSKAKENANKASNRLQKVLKSQPHVDGKTVVNSAGEITFDNTQIIPGFEGQKTLMVTYTYKNTTDEPNGAFDALLASGEFEQENDDSVVTLNMGIADTDWEMSHENYQDMYSASSSEKLKSGETKQYVDYIELDNTDNPVIFKAEDNDTRTSLGNIKLELNN